MEEIRCWKKIKYNTLEIKKKSELECHEIIKHDKRLNSQNSKGNVGFQSDQNEMKNKQSKNTKTFNCSKCLQRISKRKKSETTCQFDAF